MPDPTPAPAPELAPASPAPAPAPLAPPVQLRLPGEWAASLGTQEWLHRAAAFHMKWEPGISVVSRQDFEAALAAVLAISIR